MKIQIELSGTPQGKGRPRFANGIAYTPAKTRAFESHLRLAAQQAMNGRPLIEGPVDMRILAVYAPPKSWSKKKREAALTNKIRPTKKPDSDNVCKIVGDALNEVVYLDDKQIVDLCIRKRYGEVARLVVEIREM